MSNVQSTQSVIEQRFRFLTQHMLDEDRLGYLNRAIDRFSSYVYDRIKQKNPHKIISKSSRHLVIYGDSDADDLFIYPKWKRVQTAPSEECADEIEFAISLIASRECKNIYLLFPRTKNFKKHINIASEKLDKMGLQYTLKLIPYRIEREIYQYINEGVY